MQKLVKLPLFFFFVAAVIGVILRWHQAWSIPGFTYPFWLHAHSHIMFLGWVFNALAVNFVIQLVPAQRHPTYKTIFIVLNILLAGMLLAFPMGGYNLFSIALSTIHTIVVVVFIIRFFRDTQSAKNLLACRFARWALLFFVISSVGPFALGGLVANGMEHTSWYRLAVYYYLHFQYNGVFTFGVLALFYCLLSQYRIDVDQVYGRKAQRIMAVACFPAYVLSALYLDPGIIFNAIGFLSATLQLVALGFLTISVRGFKELLRKFPFSTRILLVFAVLSFCTKIILQLASALPQVAHLANDIRMYVIAYLHLVLIGFVSFFLLGYYQVVSLVPVIRPIPLALLLLGYLLSECSMISVGQFPADLIPISLTAASLWLAIGIGGVAWSMLLHRPRPMHDA